ncbi:MAG: hypothetical protein KAT43_02870 [Nanoarchaeota archaeon]|nr:hypothetical protein [Nanoarchaeota archaeon]
MNKNKRWTLTLFLIVLMLGITIQSAYALQISNPQVVDITGTSATVKWDTDDAANSTVKYGINNLNNIEEDSALLTEHEIVLTGLNQSAVYDLQIESANDNEDDVRSGLTFVTRQDIVVEPTVINTSIETGETLGDVPPKIKTDTLTITGITEPGATVRIFINSDRFPAQILETGGFSVVADGNGLFSATVKLYETVFKGVLGYNEVTIRFTDPSGNILEEQRTIVIDVTAPRIFLSEIQEVRNSSVIPIIGSLSEEATLRAVVDDNPAIDIEVTDKEFDAIVDVGSGEHNLTIEATDVAGNIATHTFEIKVDNTPCRLNLDTMIFTENQHFSIVTLAGNTTEPKCRIQIFNVGNNNTIQIQEIRAQGVHEYMTEFEIGVGGAIVGRAKEINSGEDSEFSTQIALAQTYTPLTPGATQMEQKLLSVSPNRILFVVFDEAGNEYTEERTIQFEPGSMMWKPGRIQTIPNTVYSSNLMAPQSTGVPVSVLYDLYYTGPTTESLKNIQATATLDQNKFDNKYIKVEETKTFYNEDENKLFVMTKLRVLPIKQGLKDVKNDLGEGEIGNTGTGMQIDFSLRTMVSYQLGQASMNEPIFIQHAVGLETPFDYTKFLTPEMINDTLELLDDWIEFLEDATKFAEEATLALTAGCVGSTLLSYLGGGASPANMKRTFMICDRVWCPTIPPDCANMNKIVTDKRGERFIYDEEKESYFNAADIKKEKPIAKIEGSVTFESREADMSAQYRYVSREKAVIGGQPVCPPGQNAIEIRSVNTSKRPLLFKRGTGTGTQLYEAGTVRYACTTMTQAEYNAASAQSASVGCYSEGPPGFHETKCFPDNADSVNDDGQVNPYDDIFISLRCGCVSGVRGHLSNFLRITQGMKKCLQQAMIGEVRGGYCERLFAQFVCDLVTWAIKKIIGTGISGSLDSGEGSVFRGNFQEVNNRLKARYSALIQNQYGLTPMQLVHKACIGAITQDWSDLRNVFQQATRVAVAPVIGPMIPESRFAAWDPFTGEAAINYYLTLGILSGGQRVSGNLRIVCDKSKAGGEYCPSGAPTLIYEEGIFVDSDQSLEKNLFYTDEHAKYWANLAVLDLTYQVGDEVKRKVKEEQIIRKSPFLAQCHFQLVPPGIICETIAGGLQAIEFKGTRLTPAVSSYYPGNNVLARSLISAVSPMLEEIQGTGAVPELYLAYNLKKPNNVVETNKNDRKILEKFKVNPMDPRGIHVAKLLQFGEAVGGPAEVLVWEGDKIQISRLGFRELIYIEAGETKTFTAELIAPQNLTGVKRAITFMELQHADVVNKKIKCTSSGYTVDCKNEAADSASFKVGTISYTIEAVSSDEIPILIAGDVKGSSLGKPIKQKISRDATSAQEEYPAGRYELNMTLYHDVDGDGVISASDTLVPYGNKRIQSHQLSFNFAKSPPTGCTSAPKVEIIYPRPDSYITKDLKSVDVKQGGIIFSLWDDCNKFSSVALYDQKSYLAATDEAKTNKDLTEPYTTYMIKQLPANEEPDSSGLYILQGKLQYNYQANDAFNLILRAVDDAGRIGEARVPVIASPGASVE